MEANAALLGRFRTLVAGEEFPVAEAALTFALAQYPHLDVGGYLARLTALGAGARERVAPGDLRPSLEALNRYLFDEWGFRGNREDYYDPRNSFLNEVLDRLLGIPITLGLVYIEVGRAVGLPLHGVAFPAHFLVGAGEGKRRLYVDAFNGGRILAEGDLGEFLEEITGVPAPLDPACLRPVAPRPFLARMLHNLKAIYLDRDDFASALAVQEFLVLLDPSHPPEVRDRGLLLLRIGRPTEGARELRRYLASAPSATDRPAIEALLREADAREGIYR